MNPEAFMKGKKLLILGGASVHIKVVEAAKRMGLYTIVTDYLADSPAKQIADKHYMFNIYDVDEIVQMCREEGVDGVISTHLDPCQRPYQQICEKLGLPCFGDSQQVFRMTDKHAFKKMCIENGVDVIEEYTETDILTDRVPYPIFIKPVDSRGSRGQSVCYDKDAALQAVEFAKQESANGDILIEKYMAGAEEVQITYFFINGEAYLVRTVDSYRGPERLQLEKVVICALSPSKHTDEYMLGAHKNVVAMLKKLGIRNGPAFMQGFYDQGKFRFFDPGLRFPGVDYEQIFRKVFGIDLVELAIEFAVTGQICLKRFPENSMNLNNNRAAVLFPVITEGTIESISGVDLLIKDERVISYLHRHMEGDTLSWSADVNQRLSEIDILCQDDASLMQTIAWIWDTLDIRSTDGRQMLLPLENMPI